MDKKKAILNLDKLSIGYSSGNRSRILLPALTGSAVKGEMVAVIGRNGIGKSTLLKSLIGLIPSLGGSIFINQKRISDYSRSELARKIGYVSTESVRANNMKVYDLVALGRYQHTNWIGTIDSVSNESIFKSLEIAGIIHLTDRYITEISDGERQRAMIAMVLAQDTDILIMDEPTAFLDVTGRYEMVHLMKELTKQGKTIIFSTHEFNIAVSQSDKIWLILESGLYEGASEDLIMNGSIGKLFDSSLIMFNPSDGSFSFRSEESKSIYVEGTPARRFWYENALVRIGYGISTVKTDPYIRLSDDTTTGCQYVYGDQVQDFSTIYDLISCMKQ